MTRTRLKQPVLPIVLILGMLAAACSSDSGRVERTPRPSAPYQSEVEEGLGVSVAILIDTSGSMKEPAAGDDRPKNEVALSAIEEMLNATEEFIARRPDFPVRIAIYHFSSSAHRVLSIRDYDRATIQTTLARIPDPGGGTAIGAAMRIARPELYRGGTFRKYLLVVTDGENTTGPDPAQIARTVYRKSEGVVQTYFIAFDTRPEKFSFLREVGGEVIAAGNESELREALNEIYRGKILAEEIDIGEG